MNQVAALHPLSTKYEHVFVVTFCKVFGRANAEGVAVDLDELKKNMKIYGGKERSIAFGTSLGILGSDTPNKVWCIFLPTMSNEKVANSPKQSIPIRL